MSLIKVKEILYRLLNIPYLSGPVNVLPRAYVEYSGLSSNEYYSGEDTTWMGEQSFLYAKIESASKDYSAFSFLLTIPRDGSYEYYDFEMKARKQGEDSIMFALKSGRFVSVKFDGSPKSLYPVIIMILDRVGTDDSNSGGRGVLSKYDLTHGSFSSAGNSR